MDLSLHGRSVIVTGPAKGMGRAITTAFAEEGASLVLASRDIAAVNSIADQARSIGANVNTVSCDVTDEAQCKNLAERTLEAFGRIDVLVNVAGGTGPIGKMGWQTQSYEFDDIVVVNMRGCFNTIRAVLPTMMSQRYGKIVNVGGTFGMRGRSGRVAYSASKWGLRGITKSFALEAGPYNININYIAPGMVEGPRFRDRVIPDMMKRLGISEEEAVERHASEYALKRISTDEDVANACLFLASDRARQITGVDLPVDGGWAML